MEKVLDILRAVDGTYWTGNSNDSVYGIFQPDTMLYSNTEMPFRLTFRVYTSGYFATADTYGYPGGVMLDGNLQILDGLIGTFEDRNTIVWNNGEVWKRVMNVPNVRLNGNDLRDQMDENESRWLNSRINNTYKTWSQFNGM